MGQAAQEDAVGGKFRRSQLGMLFHKKSITIQRHLEKLCQHFIFVGNNGRCQCQQIRTDLQRAAQNRINNLNVEISFVQDNFGFSVEGVADKHHSQFTCFFVQILPFTVGSDIPV